MDNKLLLAKSITLLYQESKLHDKVENSCDLVRTALNAVQVSEVGIGLNTDREVILALKTTILEMCNNSLSHEYDRLGLLQRIRINTGDNDRYYKAIEQGLEDSLDQDQIKKNVLNTRKTISNHFKEQQISDILNKASHTFRYQRDKIKDVNNFISEVLAQLEPLQINGAVQDPAIMSDLDLGDESALSEMFTTVKNTNEGSGILKTGWQGLNNMLGGGFRPGECFTLYALPHCYKTGSTLSIFMHLALHNIPKLIDTKKKPLLLRISLEDDLELNLQFMYQYLKYDETKERASLRDIDVKDIAKYVKEKLSVNGFHIKMIRADPGQWTYKSICNKIVELESNGYEVKALVVDYLSKLPTTGCTVTGPMGSDVCDMLNRVRNFCGSKKIFFMTPHQLSTEAKGLLRNGMPPSEFVKELPGKGFIEKTKSLDTVPDGEIYTHLFKHNKETYLAFQRGKHRGSEVLNEDDKFFMLKFPMGAPIPSDINGDDMSFKKLPSSAMSTGEDLFTLG